jgi:hypothetical protein
MAVNGPQGLSKIAAFNLQKNIFQNYLVTGLQTALNNPADLTLEEYHNILPFNALVIYNVTYLANPAGNLGWTSIRFTPVGGNAGGFYQFDFNHNIPNALNSGYVGF